MSQALNLSTDAKPKKRRFSFNWKGTVAAIVLIVAWQVLSSFSPSYLFPSLVSIAKDMVQIFSSWSLASSALYTIVRILVGVIASFVLGTAVGLFMAIYKSANEALRPILNFVQGIPALSWVVIAVIWFKPVELRIFFIILVTTTPNFIFQTFDSYRAIPADLTQMMRSLRPSPMQTFRMLVAPAMTPDLLTAWKINIGESTRVAIVAELVGATVGVGYQLQSAQSLFNMALALAWTLVLVIFVVIMQWVIGRVEHTLLSWRPNARG